MGNWGAHSPRNTLKTCRPAYLLPPFLSSISCCWVKRSGVMMCCPRSGRLPFRMVGTLSLPPTRALIHIRAPSLGQRAPDLSSDSWSHLSSLALLISKHTKGQIRSGVAIKQHGASNSSWGFKPSREDATFNYFSDHVLTFPVPELACHLSRCWDRFDWTATPKTDHPPAP